MSRKGKSIEAKSRLEFPGPLVGKSNDYKWHKGSFQGDENVLKLGCNDDCSTLNLPKIIVHLTWTNFMICNLYPPKAVINTDTEHEEERQILKFHIQ